MPVRMVSSCLRCSEREAWLARQQGSKQVRLQLLHVQGERRARRFLKPRVLPAGLNYAAAQELSDRQETDMRDWMRNIESRFQLRGRRNRCARRCEGGTVAMSSDSHPHHDHRSCVHAGGLRCYRGMAGVSQCPSSKLLIDPFPLPFPFSSHCHKRRCDAASLDAAGHARIHARPTLNDRIYTR